jgi:hypothetical protein
MVENAEIAVIHPTVERSATAASQRMRHHRERRRLGLRCTQVFEKEVDTLVRRGLLEADARNDPYAVREALHKHLSRTLGPTP